MILSQTLLEDDNTIEHVYKRYPSIIYRYRYACISTRESGNCCECATPNIRQNLRQRNYEIHYLIGCSTLCTTCDRYSLSLYLTLFLFLSFFFLLPLTRTQVPAAFIILYRDISLLIGAEIGRSYRK